MLNEFDENEVKENTPLEEVNEIRLSELSDDHKESSTSTLIKDFDDLDDIYENSKLTKSQLEDLYQDAINENNTENAEKYNALIEIFSIRDDLDLSSGDAEYVQAGGLYKDLIGKYEGYEIHHIPAKSVQEENFRYLPSIALTKEDHSHTDSYRFKSNKTYDSFLPDVNDGCTYKEDAKALIDNGEYLTLVRNELYNLKDNFGHRYDDGIKEYLDCLYQQISKKGIPKK